MQEIRFVLKRKKNCSFQKLNVKPGPEFQIDMKNITFEEDYTTIITSTNHFNTQGSFRQKKFEHFLSQAPMINYRYNAVVAVLNFSFA